MLEVDSASLSRETGSAAPNTTTKPAVHLEETAVVLEALLHYIYSPRISKKKALNDLEIPGFIGAVKKYEVKSFNNSPARDFADSITRYVDSPSSRSRGYGPRVRSDNNFPAFPSRVDFADSAGIQNGIDGRVGGVSRA